MSTYAMPAITAAGRRRRAGLAGISARVDAALWESAQIRREALETLAAITKRSRENHIAEGIALAFAGRRTRDFE